MSCRNVPAGLVGSPANFIPEDLVDAETGLASAGRIGAAGEAASAAVGFVERVNGQMDVLVASGLETIETFQIAPASSAVEESVAR